MGEHSWQENPTHIDFITTFKNKHKHQGYWFLTWIGGPGSIIVWRKTRKNEWDLEVGKEKYSWFEQIYPKLDPCTKKFYQENAYEFRKKLDKILFDYMDKNGFKGEPYEYWKPYQKQMEESIERLRRYKGKVGTAIPASQ